MPSKATKAAAQKKSGGKLKTFYWVLGGIAAIGLAAIAWSALRPGEAATEPIQLTAEQLKSTELVKSAQPVSVGDDNAPLRILIFSDFTCPACRFFATSMEPNLREEFIKTGKLQLKYYDFPLGGAGEHRWGFLAARAARCAGEQNKFWEFHDALFRNQNTWAYANKSPASEFEKYVTEVAGDVNVFKACLNSDKFADVVTANHALGESLLVGSTPTLFMNGRQLAAEWNDYAKLKARLERELGGAPPATTTTAQ